MALEKKFIEILCCPKRTCRGSLKLDKTSKNLICIECEDKYPVIGDIPILFPNSKFSPHINQRHWDDNHRANRYVEKYNKYLKKEGEPWGQYTHESELNAIERLTKDTNLEDKIILDCGCGNGRLLSVYSEARIKIGIDASLPLLRGTKEREPNFWLVCGQLEDMPFKDCMADFSISIRVFQHLTVPEDAFSEMTRITKPNGHVCLELYNKFNLKEIYKHFRMTKFINSIWPWGLGFDRYFSYREIEEWCDDNFVVPLKYSGCGWGIHFYLFDIIQFRRFAPKVIQKLTFNFFICLDKIVGGWPFFSKTLEKVCFIGSIQGERKKESITKKIVNSIKISNSLKKFSSRLLNRNYCCVSNDISHLTKCGQWLKNAQDSTNDGGVSRGFSLKQDNKSNRFGWQPSYPETTGYIIPTFIELSNILSDKDYIRRAGLMAEWELNIMFPDGAVHGGNISQQPNKAIFDTGQVIRGLISIYNYTKKSKYLDAATKSAQWICENESPDGGHWSMNNASCVNQNSTTYNIYAITPVVELGLIIKNPKFIEIGSRTANYTLTQQNNIGWFKQTDFSDAKDDSLLHTIAYTIDGLFDIGILLNNHKYTEQAKIAIDEILLQMDNKGFIPGRLNKNWKGTVEWACLTGLAQIGVTSIKLYEHTKNNSYLNSAQQIKEYLKTCQNNIDENYGGIGAMWGSWPINGDYGKYQALNWAAKYFSDLLIGCIKYKNNTQ